MTVDGGGRDVWHRLAVAVLTAVGWLVPRPRRAEWREEWRAEVWHFRRRHRDDDETGMGAGLRLVGRCLGALPHALSIRAGETGRGEMLGQDVRYGVRQLVKRPAFSAVTILTLALGIGGTAAIFSVVNTVLLTPLPIPNAERLVWMWGRTFQGRPVASVSPPDYLDYRNGVPAFEELAAYGSFAPAGVYREGDRPVELRGALVTANLLDVLGWEPALGRAFTPEETAAAEPGVVMLSHGLWQRAFGGDRSVLGRALVLDDTPYTVVGVLPPEADFPADRDYWLPLTFGAGAYASRSAHFLRPVGLLGEGVTVADAQAAVDAVSARLESAYPETNDGWYAHLQTLRRVVVGPVGPSLVILLGAVGLVLLIACANVANLHLARGASRRAEMAVRAALGASRRRVVHQLLTESVVMASVAGLLGLALAFGVTEVLRHVDPGNLPRVDELTVDGTVLLFTLGVSVTVGLVFGLAPALSLARADLSGMLGGGGRGGTAGSERRLRDLLVVAEVAVSLVLLVGASLLIRSLDEIGEVDPGFDPSGVWAVDVRFPDAFDDPGPAAVRLQEVERAVAALPGVEAVGATTILPFSGSGGDTYVFDPDRPPEQIRNIQNTAENRTATEGYLDAMDIDVVEGRGFLPSDARGSTPVVVVNEALAGWLWPERSAVGERVSVVLDSVRTFEVVGVAEDVQQYGLALPSRPQFYLSARQWPLGGGRLVVRTGAGASGVVSRLRDAVWSVDPDQPLTEMIPLASLVDRSLAQRRFQTTLLGAFALLAVTLAAVGVYGVLAYTVSRRTRELGLRMALGARHGRVVRMVVARGAGLAGVGLAVGLVGALAATRLLQGLLYEVQPTDPRAFGTATAVLALVALVASWLPARRAAAVDPAEALRDE